MISTQKLEFPGHSGGALSGRLDLPAGSVRAYALFAHCFTCSKDILAARRIAANLSRQGIAVLRFDFTGLGSSAGEFASTNFSSNARDLVLAADFMRQKFEAPKILIGHSLGGAAVLAAAGDIDEVAAVVTIGAPSDVEHVLHNFSVDLSTIEQEGSAEVSLQGRAFKIEKHFIDDARQTALQDKIAKLRKPLLVLHSPIDTVVGVENASAIFQAARHPKSYVSLDQSDHLLTRPEDAEFAASVIAGWVNRYIPADPLTAEDTVEDVRVSETGEGKFQQTVLAGRHRSFADEPLSYGGLDTGPSPYDLMSAALGACTSMTLRMYADRKGMDLGRVSVSVSHGKIHTSDCEECSAEQTSKGGRIDRFERRIEIEGRAAPELHDKLLEIADKCPVHRTLEATSAIATKIV